MGQPYFIYADYLHRKIATLIDFIVKCGASFREVLEKTAVSVL